MACTELSQALNITPYWESLGNPERGWNPSEVTQQDGGGTFALIEALEGMA